MQLQVKLPTEFIQVESWGQILVVEFKHSLKSKMVIKKVLNKTIKVLNIHNSTYIKFNKPLQLGVVPLKPVLQEQL